MPQTVSAIDKTRAFLVLAATLGTIGFNWMASAGYVNGVLPSEISDRYPTIITPASYVFTIWGLIYLGLVGFSIYQLIPRNIDRFTPIRSLYIFSCALNCAWLFFWHGEQIGISFAIAAALFVVLVLINVRTRLGRSAVNSLLVMAPFGLYLGWIAAALCVNFAVFLTYTNVKLGDMAAAAGAALVLLAAAFGVFSRIKFTNYFTPLAIAWAITAIAVKQSGRTLIVSAAAVGVIACLIAALSFVVNLPSSDTTPESNGERS